MNINLDDYQYNSNYLSIMDEIALLKQEIKRLDVEISNNLYEMWNYIDSFRPMLYTELKGIDGDGI